MHTHNTAAKLGVTAANLGVTAASLGVTAASLGVTAANLDVTAVLRLTLNKRPFHYMRKTRPCIEKGHTLKL